MAKKGSSSGRWLQEHEQDEYVKLARERGYRARASFKFLEINEKFKLLKRGMSVVDLGAAPGGWSQVAAPIVGSEGQVIALDILAMDPIDGVTLLQGDFTEDEVYQNLLSLIEDQPVDLVISDMAPNLSGMKAIDQPRAAYLAELAIDLAVSVLRKKGALLVKCFEGEGISELRKAFQQHFDQVTNFKPRASRGRSREIYLLGRGFKR